MVICTPNANSGTYVCANTDGRGKTHSLQEMRKHLTWTQRTCTCVRDTELHGRYCVLSKSAVCCRRKVMLLPSLSTHPTYRPSYLSSSASRARPLLCTYIQYFPNSLVIVVVVLVYRSKVLFLFRCARDTVRNRSLGPAIPPRHPGGPAL